MCTYRSLLPYSRLKLKGKEYYWSSETRNTLNALKNAKFVESGNFHGGNFLSCQPGDDDCNFESNSLRFWRFWKVIFQVLKMFESLKSFYGSRWWQIQFQKFCLKFYCFHLLGCSVPNRFSLRTLFEELAVGREIKENCPFPPTHPPPQCLSFLIFLNV